MFHCPSGVHLARGFTCRRLHAAEQAQRTAQAACDAAEAKIAVIA
jgi:hypothetical protein